eukprot:2320050-Rhodomonas_salina.1
MGHTPTPRPTRRQRQPNPTWLPSTLDCQLLPSAARHARVSYLPRVPGRRPRIGSVGAVGVAAAGGRVQEAEARALCL